MGTFRIVIEGVGAHGDDRIAREGERITLNLGAYRSPDAIAKDTVEQLRAVGVIDLTATLTHWPGTPEEVVDDLVIMTRVKGSF